MIKIGNKRRGDKGEYCGRSTPLGNPFTMVSTSIAERNRVCDAYDKWLWDSIRRQDENIVKELDRLNKIHKDTGELTLLCWCAPLRCHCETIRSYLETGGWKNHCKDIHISRDTYTNTGRGK